MKENAIKKTVLAERTMAMYNNSIHVEFNNSNVNTTEPQSNDANSKKKTT